MLLIKNGYIKTMAGAEYENGYVLIDDNGKIAEVGAEYTGTADEVIDAEGRLVTPGCVEAHCHTGLSGYAMGWAGKDINESADPITPQMRAIDGFNPMDESLSLALRGGVTTACTGPGSTNIIGGTFAAMKLAGKRADTMIVKFPLAMKCAFGENPKNTYGQGKKKS
ncbi:MAG: amidohydrolase, partial [Oscillospiraceae bacterium]|nr:amidohydrolase [Oscillospiraceae bacterium]